MHTGIVGVERGPRCLEGKLPVNFDAFGTALIEQGQHLRADLLLRRDAAVQAQPGDHRELAFDQCPEGTRQLADFGV